MYEYVIIEIDSDGFHKRGFACMLHDASGRNLQKNQFIVHKLYVDDILEIYNQGLVDKSLVEEESLF